MTLLGGGEGGFFLKGVQSSQKAASFCEPFLDSTSVTEKERKTSAVDWGVAGRPICLKKKTYHRLPTKPGTG